MELCNLWIWYLQNVYNKQKAEVVKQNRGYQTMEAKEHPDVKKSEKAKGMSDVGIKLITKYLNYTL